MTASEHTELLPADEEALFMVGDITARANAMGLGFAKYPVADIEKVVALAKSAAPDGAEPVPVAWRDETDAENIARDIAEGRFPARSEKQKVPDVPDAWDRIAADPELARARQKLSMHELRHIIRHATEAHAALFASPTGMGVTEEQVERALDAADYVPNDDNRVWMRLALTAALHPTSETTEVERFPKTLGAVHQAIDEYIDSLMARQHGGVAENKAFTAICAALGREPIRELDARRATAEARHG